MIVFMSNSFTVLRLMPPRHASLRHAGILGRSLRLGTEVGCLVVSVGDLLKEVIHLSQ